MSNFEELRIVDNFYQTSAYYPMPVVAITTVNEAGLTNIGPYSLCLPYYVAGKDYYAMLLETRNNSNTAINLLTNGRCVLNFIPDSKKFMKNCVRLGFPGDTTEEKMAESIYTLQKNDYINDGDGKHRWPEVISESYQSFICSWVSELEDAGRFGVQESYVPPYNDFNGITSEMGAHFILKIEKIYMKPEYKKGIIDGVKKSSFPPVPVDYGYRDNTNFWIAGFKKPYTEAIPDKKGMGLDTVKYAADRIDPDFKFTDEACAEMVKVPRIFLKTALNGCVDWARENNVSLITAEHMKIIRDKRAGEKAK